MWKQKLKKHEEKTALVASYAYRNEKRIEKQRQKNIEQAYDDSLVTAVQKQAKAKKQDSSVTENNDLLGQHILSAQPTESDLITSYSVSQAAKLKDKDKSKEQVYEFVDFDDPECHVVAFKKISVNKPEVRLNCFVTSFPFSGHSIQNE